MLVVCLRIKVLLWADFESIKREHAWYALIMLGLIKETVIVFLACFFVCRLVCRWLSRERKISLREVMRFLFDKQELEVFYSIFLPILLYLGLRSVLVTSRGFRPDLIGLLNPSIYRAIGQSFVEQYGPFLILFMAGCILLLLGKEFSSLNFILVVFIATPLFFSVDSSGDHAGYSRFNLYILPVILTAALGILKNVRLGKIMGIIVACVVIGGNLLLSPVYTNGIKKPFWGNYLLDTSDHYYPYRQALVWLKENHGQERIFFTGMNYGYYFDFYFNQLNWKPSYKFDQNLISGDYHEDFAMYFDDSEWAPKRKIDRWLNNSNESIILSQALERAKKGGYDVVLYHVLGREIPHLLERDSGQFLLAKVFQNQAHALLVYVRK